MPSTVNQLLNYADLELSGKVKWGERFQSYSTGVYIVSLSEDPNANFGLLEKAPISPFMIQFWVTKVPSIELDSVRNPKPKDIANRLSEFWLSDENILCIGKTTQALSKRIKQYYDTELGDRRPHAGGHWLKTLSNLDQLSVYYAECPRPEIIEGKLLQWFIDRVSHRSLSDLRDPLSPFPFANLEYPKGNRKNHGIGKAKL